jgi:rod shape-determining protein MreC
VYDKTVRRRRAVLGLLVICSLILLTASFGGSSGPLGSIQRGVFEVISPIQDGASRALKPFRDLFGWFGDTLDAKGENKDLRKERDELRVQVARLQDDARANADLRRQLGLAKQLSFDQMGPVSARVSGASPTVWFQTLYINKGSTDGIRVDQPVVANGGLVGRVSTVTPRASVVRLLTDSRFAASARISQSGVVGLVKAAAGSPRDLVMKYLTASDVVERGQIVVTKGTDSRRFASLFPQGIPIGRVTKVDDPGSDSQQVHIRPYVNPRDVDYVQVLTKIPDGVHA